MKTNLILTGLFITISVFAFAQNYTSINDGAWTTATNWSNTSGWGAATPLIDGSHGSGTITMKNNISISSVYNTGSATLNINAGKILTLNAAMTVGGGSAVNVSGNLVIYGDPTLNSTLTILPGGIVTVYGSVIVNNSNYLIVGTSAAGPPYADLIIKNDLKQVSSGDVTLNKNSRVAVFGNVTDDTGGGTNLKLNNGAEMYVNSNVSYVGGGDHIDNNNTVSPYGLYVNGTTSNPGGGSTTTSNKANKATMATTNIPFANWVNSQESLMPVTLTSFKVAGVSDAGIELTWTTASEEHLDYFIIESSVDGREFVELAQQKEHGYLVEDPIVGKSYYRLTSVDVDGSKQVFGIVGANYSTLKTVSLFPNPIVDSKLNIEFNFSPTEDVTVTITNLNGVEISRQTINGMENLLPLTLETGTYLVRVQSSEISTVSRILIK